MTEIWGSGAGLALAGLRQKFREMKHLELDMIAMDQPGFTKTIQESSIYYSNGNAIGISEGEVKEVSDGDAENQLRGLSSQIKSSENLQKYLAEFEKVFGHMGGTNTFINSGNKIVTTINTICSQGGDIPANKMAVINAVKDHLRQIANAANTLQNIRNSASNDFAGQIAEINQLLTDIAGINASMSTSGSASGSNISYLRQRRVMLDKLSEYMQIQVSDKTGSFLVYTPNGRVIVQDSLAAQYIFSPAAQIDASQTFGPGTISLQSIGADTTSQESPSTGTDTSSTNPNYPGDPNYYDRRQEAFIFDVSKDFSNSLGGSLSGLMQFLQTDSVQFGQQLDSYAAGLRDSFNAVHNLSSAINPAPILQGGPGYIGGSSVVGALPITAQGVLRVAVINNTSNDATATADIDLSSAIAQGSTIYQATDVNGLCYLINNNPTLAGHVNATIVNGTLQISTSDAGCGVSLGSVSGQALPTVSLSTVGSTAYGFAEFFHLNDFITTQPQFWRDGTIAGLASSISVNSTILSNPNGFSIRQLRNDETLDLAAQAVSGDPSIGRALSDLFTRTNSKFVTPTGATVTQTLESFSTSLVNQVASEVGFLKSDMEAQSEAYRQQEALFSQNYGMDEQEIAMRSMQISKSQDLYFSFLNNYWRMIGRIADMGR